jgi:hypothetical protein
MGEGVLMLDLRKQMAADTALGVVTEEEKVE